LRRFILTLQNQLKRLRKWSTLLFE
jgi:hypothetical protein